ncbi:MAG: MarR family transcriptional regulator [Desulfobacterales bacterium]|nr:MarR family transcriptional regulator [Deltaproteobacteria bacterium]NNL43772.1 MarR family transcriptional regulator [Desulfobacterales bacterium]
MKKMDQKSVHRNRKNPMPSENVTQIVQGLLKCGQFLQREMNQVCQRFGLKQQQFTVLNEIVWHGPISQKELGETLLFEKSNVSKIVKILFEKRWIQVAVATHDRRLTLLTETPEGFAVWKQSMQAFNQSSSVLISILSEDEQVNAIRLLNKLGKAFKRK